MAAMAADSPNNLRSYAGQTVWRRRIQKEIAALPPVRKDNFSLRSLLKTAGVPIRFKPEHLNPHENKPVLGLDTETEKMLRADIATKNAVPAEQLLWPDTSQQEVGWLASPPKPGLPWDERGTLQGCSPRIGLGWISSRNEGARIAQMTMSARLPRSKTEMLEDKLIGLERGAVTEAVVSFKADVPLSARERRDAKRQEARRLRGLLEDWEASKQVRRERRLQRLQARASSQDSQEPSDMLAQTSAPSKMELPHFVSPAGSAGLRNRIPIALQDRWALTDGGPLIPRPTGQDQSALAGAGSKIQGFYKPERLWNKPKKAQCDVVAFGEAYTRLWGCSLFGKQASKGSELVGDCSLPDAHGSV